MADLSPELAARIQALETSYADNPGRYFVALAGAWREAGETGRAEEILRENIKRFPGLSPHVLLGRCLADRGAYQEAANEFHYVLSIDAQNLIALRTLAEMAAAGGRRAEAERWYNELLAVDPMNAEARAALAELARGGADAATADQPAQVGTGWGGAAETAPAAGGPGADDEDATEFGMIDLAAPSTSAADASGVAGGDADDWGDLTLDVPGGEGSVAAPGGEFDAFGFGSVDLDAPGGTDAGEETGGVAEWLAADARQDLGQSAAEDRGALAPTEETFPEGDESAPELTFLDDEDAGDELPLLDTGAAPAFPAFDAPGDAGFPSFDAPGEDASAGLPSFAAAGPEAHGEHADHEVDAEMVTETMAELYAAQGLQQQAADVYRELIRQRGEEPGLVRRLAEIEARLHPVEPPAAETPAASSDEETPDWLASVDAFAGGAAAGGVDAPDDVFAAPGPAAGLGAAEPVDAFADSFAGGFSGAEEAEPASTSADGGSGREPWQAPAVSETEPVGFDLIVVEEGEEMVPAPPEVVADVSADWAIAAAPLEEQEEKAVEAAVPAAATVASQARTVRAYFTGLLAWHPGAVAATAAPPPVAEEPAYEAPSAPAEPETDEEPWAETPAAPLEAPPAHEPAAEDDPWAAPAAETPADETVAAEAEPWAAPAAEAPADETVAAEAEPWGAPAAEAPADEAVAGGDEPWGTSAAEAPAEEAASAGDEPWGAPAAEAPAEYAAGPDEIPLMDLGDEPWAEAPRPSAPVDITTFELADEIAPPRADAAPPEAPAESSANADSGADEEPLPWELPAEPAAPAPSGEPELSPFSFEDFFAGTPPAAPAAPPAPEPEPAQAEPEPELPAGFTPSAAFEPLPEPSAPPAPAPPPASSAPQQGAGQDEEDEDLESFQAWLQSLKR